MSLLATIKSVLGLAPRPEPSHGGPFRLAPAARAAVERLPEGQALHVTTVPVVGGHAVRATVADGAGSPVVSAEDLDRLAGIVLDWDGERFVPTVPLTVVSSETPNPDARLYETDRWLVRGYPQSFTRGAADLPPLARRVLAVPHVVAVLFRGNTVSVERSEQASWGAIDRGVEAALREHLLLCGRHLEPPDLEDQPDDALFQAVRHVIEEEVLPRIHRDGGDLRLISVRDGVVLVEMHGACNTCPAATLTLKAGVERALKEALPGRIDRVVQT